MVMTCIIVGDRVVWLCRHVAVRKDIVFCNTSVYRNGKYPVQISSQKGYSDVVTALVCAGAQTP